MLQRLCDTNDQCGESPLWDTYSQTLYWTDILSRQMYACNWRSREIRTVLANFEVSGCQFDISGAFILVNSAGVWQWVQGRHPINLCNRDGLNELKLNDCAADTAGRLVTASCFYDPLGEYKAGMLFSVNCDLSIHVLDSGFHLANGIGFSADGRSMYVADSVAKTIYHYDYYPETGKAQNRRDFVVFDATSGVPDGLRVDAEGFIWSAEWYGSCIRRYDPDGTLERKVPVPAKQCSSLAFGGPNLDDIFVTTAATPEPMPVMPLAYDPTNGYFGGALFHINLGIQGRVENRTRFDLAFHG